MSSDGPVHFPSSEPAEPQLNGHGEPHDALADTDTDLHTDAAADETEVGQTEVGQSIQTAETGADEDPTVLLEQNAAPAAVLNSSSSSPPSRTVAIIKPHALEHRFNIESRISEAGFEVSVLLRPSSVHFPLGVVSSPFPCCPSVLRHVLMSRVR
jgi:hypothetical protein